MEIDTVSHIGGLVKDSDFTAASFIGFLILCILLIISALISGSEVALFSLSNKQIEGLKNTQSKRSRLVLRLLSKPEHLLSAVLAGNIFVNITFVLFSTHLAYRLFDFTDAPVLGFMILVVIIFSLILLFGEIIPKVYAIHNPKTFALRFIPLINVLVKITQPINFLLVNSTSLVKMRLNKYKRNLSIEEISKALTDQDEYSDEKEILEGIVRFGTKTVDEVMCPRLNVVCIEVHSNFEEVLKIIRESGYSRIPVYKETLDNVRGILYIKDLLAHLEKGLGFRWQPLMRQPIFVPESKKIDDLLEEFQKSQVHMAIVVDEYGGTSGLVTLEDILEEIVGDITDEFDEENPYFTKIAENEYIFEGSTLLPDFYKTTGYEETVFDEIKGEAETLAGLILEMTKEMPGAHEKIKYKNLTFEVEDVDARRINKIRVTIISPVNFHK